MQCIYAEKFDVGLKIAIALGGGLETENAGTVTLANVEKKKDKLRSIKNDGSIYIKNNGIPITVTWGQGHMGELWQAKDYDPSYAQWRNLPLPFIPETHNVKIREGYDRKTGKKTGEPDPFAERQLGIIERCFKKADEIIIATDDDREGDLIAYYVFKLLDMDVPYTRMLLDSMTENGIKEAYQNRVDGSTRKGIVAAGRCRAIADLDVGANLTVAATLTYSQNLGLKLVSVGRIQTAVLNFIVEREKAIQSFISTPFWTINGEFTLPDGGKYTGTTERFLKKEECEAAINSFGGKQGQITKLKTTPTTSKVPLLYNLADLQINANRYLGISAATTLEVAQSLYDKGFISYPRTASRHLTDDMVPKVNTYLDNLAARNSEYAGWIPPRGNRHFTKRHFDTSKVESHYAICITESIPDPSKLTPLEAKVYDMIAKSVIRIAHEDAIIEKTSVETTVNGVVFKTNGQKIKKPGWMIVSSTGKKDVLLPAMNYGDIVSGEYTMKEGATEPPKRYTEATLLTAMQTCSKEIDDDKLKAILKDKNDGGIGRPSTQANIIQTVVTRYCHLEKKTIVPTESAMALIDALPVEDLKSPEITASWEAKLDAVEKRKMNPVDFLTEINESVYKWTEEIMSSQAKTVASAQGSGLVCPVCGQPMYFTKKGGAICKGYFDQSCYFGVNGEVAHKKLTKSQITQLVETGRTKEIKGFVARSGKTFSASLVLQEDRETGKLTTGFEFSERKRKGW